MNPYQNYMSMNGNANMYQTPQMPNFNYNMPFQMPQQVNSIYGKVIDDISNVGANDVPMDGSSAVFLKNDKSVIYVKQWQPNGTITTIMYKPIVDQKQTDIDNVSANGEKLKFEPSDEFVKALNERFDKLESMFDLRGGKNE